MNGFNGNGVREGSIGAFLVAPQVTATGPTMGLNVDSRKETITRQVLLLKPGKLGNGQRGQRVDFGAFTATPSVTPSQGLRRISEPMATPLAASLPPSRSINADTNGTSCGNSRETNGPLNPEARHLSDPKGREAIQASLGSLAPEECSVKRDQRTQKEASTHQISIERRAERLLRRIKRMQGKQTQKHLHRHLKALVKHEQVATGIGCQHASFQHKDVCKDSSPGPMGLYPQSVGASSAEEKMKLFSPEGVKSLSTSALVNLVKRLENSGHLNESARYQTPSSSPSSSQALPVSTSTAFPSEDMLGQVGESSLVRLLQQRRVSSLSGAAFGFPSKPHLNSGENEQIEQTVGTLKSNLHHVETGYDSDATESSSGGESCDEFDELMGCNRKTSSSSFASFTGLTSVQRRVGWKWAVDRGAIASRWMWLIAQVADLEFKIRQQNEMYRTLRTTKGTVGFDVHDHCLLRNSLSTSESQRTSPVEATVSVTGSYGIPEVTKALKQEDEVKHCVRTMPLKPIRKRKLVRSVSALSGATRKIARYSTVQCSCNSLPGFVSPCLLCSGRYSYVQVIDTDCMPQFERVALLDLSCHPVLSLPNDVSLGLHFSKFLKKETVQKPVSAKHQYKKRKNPSSPEFASRYGKDIRKSNHKKSQAIISSNKLRKKYDGSSKRKYSNHSNESGFSKKSKGRDRNDSGSNESEDSSRNDSPVASPLPLESISGKLNRRRRSEQHAYDINNIVIPYSIASTTRVEKLQYKEIITPKWRVSEATQELVEEPPPVVVLVESDVFEDLSDEVFAERHEKCETDERKRFFPFPGPPGTPANGPGRGRGIRMRFDSKSDNGLLLGVDSCAQSLDNSSQDSFPPTMTPTPTPTPTPIAISITASVSITTPFMTPPIISSNTSSALLTQDQSTQEDTHGTPARAIERRRTTSSSRRDDSLEEEVTFDVTPYERRSFPISEKEFEEMLEASRQCEELEAPEEPAQPETEASASPIFGPLPLGDSVLVDGELRATLPDVSDPSGAPVDKVNQVKIEEATTGCSESGGVRPLGSGGDGEPATEEEEKKDPEWEPRVE